MSIHLTAFRQTADTWAKLIKHPEDRRETLGPVVEAAGGKLVGYWYAFGEVDYRAPGGERRACGERRLSLTSARLRCAGPACG